MTPAQARVMLMIDQGRRVPLRRYSRTLTKLIDVGLVRTGRAGFLEFTPAGRVFIERSKNAQQTSEGIRRPA